MIIKASVCSGPLINQPTQSQQVVLVSVHTQYTLVFPLKNACGKSFGRNLFQLLNLLTNSLPQEGLAVKEGLYVKGVFFILG